MTQSLGSWPWWAGVLAALAITASVGTLGCGGSGTDWATVCNTLDAKARECGEVLFVQCGDTLFSDCTNEEEISDQLRGCSASCERLRDCLYIVCEE